MGVVVTGKPTSPVGAMGPFDFIKLTMLSMGYIVPEMYPIFCFMGCQAIPDCNYWSYYITEIFCQFFETVDALSPVPLPNMFAARNCNPDDRAPEDTTTTTQDTTTTSTSTTTTSTSTTTGYFDIAVEEECFTADTFSLGEQVGTGPYPCPNAYECAAACVALPACEYWTKMDVSEYGILLGSNGGSGQMETAGAWFGAKFCAEDLSPTCAQIGACELPPIPG